MCTSNAGMGISIPANEEPGMLVGIRVLSIATSMTEERLTERVLVLGGSVCVDFEPILSLVLVGLGHDQRNVEVLPDRGGMLSNTVALRPGFNALSSLGIEPG